jgi:5'-methylthioadenosine phosphorylase
MRTPYGEPSSPISFGYIKGKPVIQLARHGLGHFLAPHEINYRANIWALKELGATEILALGAVSSLSDDFEIGRWVIPHDFIDHTWGRAHTFFEGPDKPVRHINMSHPVCTSFRSRMLNVVNEQSLPIINHGVYVCVQGPRLETPAESRMYLHSGGDVVGMIAMPEASLAKELDLSYVICCLISNPAAHRARCDQDLSLSFNGDSIAPIIDLLNHLD